MPRLDVLAVSVWHCSSHLSPEVEVVGSNTSLGNEIDDLPEREGKETKAKAAVRRCGPPQMIQPGWVLVASRCVSLTAEIRGNSLLDEFHRHPLFLVAFMLKNPH